MVYKKFCENGVQHSLLGFGAMRLPTCEDGSIDVVAADAMMKLAIDSGVSYFDTAYIYHEGKSEEYLRRFFASYARERYQLADKLPIWLLQEPEDMERIFNEQLERCGVQYFDYYLAHSVGRSSLEKMGELGTIKFLQRKRAEGKIKSLGFSFHDDAQCFAEALTVCDWDFCQLQLNYADWNRFGASKLYELAEQKQIPIIVMEPVRGGFLANPPQQAAELLHNANPNRSAASWALRFVASLPQVKLVLSGMSTMEQVTDNLRTFCDTDVYLSDEEQAVIAKVMDTLDGMHTLPCTGCRYCMPCPVGIEIPTVFECYNNCKFLGGRGSDAYLKLAPEHRAESCISCGACLKHCPQQIAIPERMTEVAEYFKRD